MKEKTKYSQIIYQVFLQNL